MARWMVSGGCVSGGDQAIEFGVDQLLLLGEVFAQVHAFSGRNGSGCDLALLADQHFDARFGLFQLFAAGVAEAHAVLEELERALQRKIAGLQFLDDLFQFVEAGFEGQDGGGWCGGIGHALL